jgi:uncharacterized membrane protein
MQTSNWLKREWLPIGVLAAPFVLIAARWSSFPGRIAIHWGLHGQPNAWVGRGGLFIFPLIGIGAWLLLTNLRRLDPKLKGVALEGRGLTAIKMAQLAIVSLLSFVSVMVAIAALGFRMNMTVVVLDAVLLASIVLGNFSGNFRPNYFTGMRTPWTLQDPEVWRDTHRVGGRLMVAGSILLFLVQGAFGPVVFVKAAVAWFFAFMIWRYVYSFLRFRSRHAPEAPAGTSAG